MAIRFVCPHCGGRLTVADALAGRWGVCPKCGARCLAQGSSATEGTLHTTGAGAQASPQDQQRAAVATKTGAKRGSRRYAVVATIAAIGLLAAAIGSWSVWLRDTWEQDNRDSLLAMCYEAAAFAKSGDLTNFTAKDTEILALVGTRRILGQELKAALQRVEDARNILTLAAKREAEGVGRAEDARRSAEQERQRLEAQVKQAREDKQRQEEQAQRLSQEEKKRQEEAEAQRRAEEEKQRLAKEASRAAQDEKQRLLPEAQERAKEEDQRQADERTKAEAERQRVEAQTRSKADQEEQRQAEARRRAEVAQRRQEAKEALAKELGPVTAALEQAKAQGLAAVATRSQLMRQFDAARANVEEQYKQMRQQIRLELPPLPPLYLDEAARQRADEQYRRQFAEAQRRYSDRLLAAQAWRADELRKIDQQFQPKFAEVNGRINQLAAEVKGLMQQQADLQRKAK